MLVSPCSKANNKPENAHKTVHIRVLEGDCLSHVNCVGHHLMKNTNDITVLLQSLPLFVVSPTGVRRLATCGYTWFVSNFFRNQHGGDRTSAKLI